MHRKKKVQIIKVAGLALLGLQAALVYLSQFFIYDSSEDIKYIPPVVALMALSGAVYLFAVIKIPKTETGRNVFIWMICLGAALRLVTFASTPIMEDDYYRYLWDGSVFANGYSPFEWIPSDVLNGEAHVPEGLVNLGIASGQTLERVNHPDIRTIYPPVTQAAFSMAYYISPWSFNAWRVVLLMFDVAALLLLVLALKEAGLPILFAAVYWWNPLLVKEIYNSAHMDIIVLPFVIGSILLAAKGRHFTAAVSLALAVGAKIWPIVLLPLILRSCFKKPTLVLSLSAFGILSIAFFIPILAAGLDSDSGFNAYGSYWEMNDALFMLFLWSSEALLDVLNVTAFDADLAARGIVFGIIMGIVVYVSTFGAQPAGSRCDNNPVPDLFNRCLIIVTAVFMLSPTQFPWYFLWMLPFLVLNPRTSLLLLTVMLPMYYLRFYMDHFDKKTIFDNWLVWIEYAPVWGLLIWEWRRGKARLAPTGE